MFELNNNIDAPNVVMQIPISVAPFGNAGSIGQLNFAEDSNGVGFSNSSGLGQFDGFF